MTEYEEIIICAMRYALGRRTYVVRTVCEYIENERKKLSDYCIKIMIRDIESQGDIPGGYGDTWDEERWMHLLWILKERIGENNDEEGSI